MRSLSLKVKKNPEKICAWESDRSQVTAPCEHEINRLQKKTPEKAAEKSEETKPGVLITTDLWEEISENSNSNREHEIHNETTAVTPSSPQSRVDGSPSIATDKNPATKQCSSLLDKPIPPAVTDSGVQVDLEKQKKEDLRVIEMRRVQSMKMRAIFEGYKEATIKEKKIEIHDTQSIDEKKLEMHDTKSIVEKDYLISASGNSPSLADKSTFVENFNPVSLPSGSILITSVESPSQNNEPFFLSSKHSPPLPTELSSASVNSPCQDVQTPFTASAIEDEAPHNEKSHIAAGQSGAENLPILDHSVESNGHDCEESDSEDESKLVGKLSIEELLAVIDAKGSGGAINVNGDYESEKSNLEEQSGSTNNSNISSMYPISYAGPIAPASSAAGTNPISIGEMTPCNRYRPIIESDGNSTSKIALTLSEKKMTPHNDRVCPTGDEGTLLLPIIQTEILPSPTDSSISTAELFEMYVGNEQIFLDRSIHEHEQAKIILNESEQLKNRGNLKEEKMTESDSCSKISDSIGSRVKVKIECVDNSSGTKNSLPESGLVNIPRCGTINTSTQEAKVFYPAKYLRKVGKIIKPVTIELRLPQVKEAEEIISYDVHYNDSSTSLSDIMDDVIECSMAKLCNTSSMESKKNSQLENVAIHYEKDTIRSKNKADPTTSRQTLHEKNSTFKKKYNRSVSEFTVAACDIIGCSNNEFPITREREYKFQKQVKTCEEIVNQKSLTSRRLVRRDKSSCSAKEIEKRSGQASSRVVDKQSTQASSKAIDKQSARVSVALEKETDLCVSRRSNKCPSQTSVTGERLLEKATAMPITKENNTMKQNDQIISQSKGSLCVNRKTERNSIDPGMASQKLKLHSFLSLDTEFYSPLRGDMSPSEVSYVSQKGSKPAYQK